MLSTLLKGTAAKPCSITSPSHIVLTGLGSNQLLFVRKSKALTRLVAATQPSCKIRLIVRLTDEEYKGGGRRTLEVESTVDQTKQTEEHVQEDAPEYGQG